MGVLGTIAETDIQIPVSSSFIAMMSYRMVTLTLTVYFKSGKTYAYAPVFPTEIAPFLDQQFNGSTGQWFNSRIKPLNGSEV